MVHYLEGVWYLVQVYANDNNLKYLHRAKTLNQWQLQWVLYFSHFDFISYCLGSWNSKADMLTYKGEYCVDPERPNQETSCILKPHNFLGAMVSHDLLVLIQVAAITGTPTDKHEAIN